DQDPSVKIIPILKNSITLKEKNSKTSIDKEMSTEIKIENSTQINKNIENNTAVKTENNLESTETNSLHKNRSRSTSSPSPVNSSTILQTPASPTVQISRRGPPPSRLDTSNAVTGGKIPGVLVASAQSANAISNSKSNNSNIPNTQIEPGRNSFAFKSITKTQSFYNPSTSKFDSSPSTARSSLGVSSPENSPKSISGSFSSSSFKQNFGFTASSLPSPGYLSLAEFKQRDTKPRWQRFILYQLYTTDMIRSKVGVTNRVRKDSGKKEKGQSTLSKLNALLKPKKKKKSVAVTFHLLNLAIHDNRTSAACTLLEDLTPNSLKKKRPNETNNCFLHAVANGLESVCLVLLEKGFPINVNAPAVSTTISQPMINQKKSNNNTEPFAFPSYFMTVVGIGLDNVVRSMVKKANVNQTWYGLSPLHLACCKGNPGVIRSLLENGADHNFGLPFETYTLLCKIKSDAAKAATSLISSSSYKRQFGSKTITAHKKGVKNSDKSLNKDDGTTISPPLTSTSMPHSHLPETFFKNKKIFPVELACAGKHVDACKLLLLKYDTKTIQHLTYPYFAQQSLEISCIFLKNGLNPESTFDPWGSNAVQVAARNGNLGFLIAFFHCFKIDINKRGENNWTFLHEAISQKHKAVAQFLIRNGADITCLNNDSETAHSVGLRVGISENELKEYFAKSTVSIEETQIMELIQKYLLPDPVFQKATSSPEQKNLQKTRWRALEKEKSNGSFAEYNGSEELLPVSTNSNNSSLLDSSISTNTNSATSSPSQKVSSKLSGEAASFFKVFKKA
ncbi:hypothetical protein HK099_005036, partial [Clydaea vesicula]